MAHVKITAPSEHYTAVSEALATLPGIGDRAATFDQPESRFEFDIDDAAAVRTSSILLLVATKIEVDEAN